MIYVKGFFGLVLLTCVGLFGVAIIVNLVHMIVITAEWSWELLQ